MHRVACLVLSLPVAVAMAALWMAVTWAAATWLAPAWVPPRWVATATAETLPGPVAARVERVVDGDTIAVTARVWLGQDVHVLVRVRGIDAPELRGRCAEETRRARAATRRAAAAVAAGSVTLWRISGDKYHGRVLADCGPAVRRP